VRLRLIAIVIIVATVLGGAWVGRDLVENGSGGGWSHEAGEAFDAERVLFATFERSRPNLTFLVQARVGDVDGPEVESAVADFLDRLEQRPDVSQIESYWSLGKPEWMRSDDGTLALIHAKVGGVSDDYANRAGNLTPLLRTVDDSVRITMGGQVVVHRDIQAAAQASVMPIVLVALVSIALVFLALRNAIATGLVATTSLLAVALTLIGLYGLAQFREMPVMAVVLGVISAWGLATASGYLMLSRFMSERAARAGRRDAVVATVSTAGRTVAIAAAVSAATGIALWALPTSLLRSTAYAIGLAGLSAGVSAIIVLGLLLAVVGVDVMPKEVSSQRLSRLDPVTRAVQQRPVAALVVLAAVLVPVLWLSFGLRVGEPTAVSLGPGESSRQVAQQITAKFPSNDADAPFVVSPSVVDFSSSDQLTAEYAAALSRIDGVARVDSDQGTFVDGGVIDVPNAVISRHVGDQRTWLEAPVAGLGTSGAAERVLEEIKDVMAPFRVVIGGAAARQLGTAEAVTERTPIFAGIVLLLVVVLMAWLLRSVSAAIRGSIVIVLMTSVGLALIQYGFADGRLRTLFSFSSDGSVAAVGPPIAWVLSVGIAAAASIFAWGAIRELFDRTRDATTAPRHALVATRDAHLVATALLVLPLLPLLVNGWRTAKLIGTATVATGLVMMTVGRFIALPAAASLAPSRLWPVKRDGEVRRVYPATPASIAFVERAEAADAAAYAETEAREEERRASVAEEEAVAAETAPDPKPAVELPADRGAVPSSAAAVAIVEPEITDEIVPVEVAEAATAASPEPTAPGEAQPAETDGEAEPAEPVEVVKAQAPEVVLDEVAAEPAAVPVAIDAGDEPVAVEAADAQPAASVLEEVVVEPEVADVPVAVEEAVEEAVGATPAAVDVSLDEELDAAVPVLEVVEEAPTASTEIEDDAAAVAEAEAAVAHAADTALDEAIAAHEEIARAADVEPATVDEVETAPADVPAPVAATPRSRPAAGTVDVASLTESVIAAMEKTTVFTTELNSAYVANPANNLSRVMEAILRDASSRGGEEVLVYGHASRDRYRWMVVDSGPEAADDTSRARTLAEAQRFIRRVGGVVECRPEGEFTVFVVEIPMAS
jgi:RND superfamily putative drug exporter